MTKRNVLAALLQILGIALAVVACWSVFVPLGVLAAGGACFGIGYGIERGS